MFEKDFNLVERLYRMLNSAIDKLPKGRGSSKTSCALVYWQNILMSLLALMLGLTISLPEGKKQKLVSKAVKAIEPKKDAGKQESSLSQVSAPEIG